jgi:hypothetical protein
LKEGEEIRVDGTQSWVGRIGAAGPAGRLPSLVFPPPAGAKERRAARLRNGATLAWGLYLAGFFLLPERWAYAPTIRALDALLWPVVRFAGRPATVVLLAAIVAIAALLVQKFVTDNARLLVAKRRAAALRKTAASLPRGSPKRRSLDALAAGVQWRILMAAMVPVGLLLGPMVAPFAWMKARIAPEAWNAPAGAGGGVVQVVALVDGEYSGAVHLETPPAVAVDDTTPADRLLPPLRKTLESLLALYRASAATAAGASATEPWQLALGPATSRAAAAADLDAYLRAGIPPQALTWVLHPPAGFDGAFPVRLANASATVVLGESRPPALAAPVSAGPVRSLQIVYPRPTVERVFFRPLRPLGGKLGAWDAGWIGVYVGAYVMVLLLVRWLLQVA